MIHDEGTISMTDHPRSQSTTGFTVDRPNLPATQTAKTQYSQTLSPLTMDRPHPFSSEENHGIGTRSVLAFVNKTNSEIHYLAEEKRFRVRMIV